MFVWFSPQFVETRFVILTHICLQIGGSTFPRAEFVDGYSAFLKFETFGKGENLRKEYNFYNVWRCKYKYIYICMCMYIYIHVYVKNNLLYTINWQWKRTRCWPLWMILGFWSVLVFVLCVFQFKPPPPHFPYSSKTRAHVLCQFPWILWLYKVRWAMKKTLGWLGYIGDYTTQLYRDYNKPL